MVSIGQDPWRYAPDNKTLKWPVKLLVCVAGVISAFLFPVVPREGARQDLAMPDRAIIATGAALIIGALLAFSNWLIGILIIAAGAFLVIWGNSRAATEAVVAELPVVGPALLKGLAYLQPLISPLPPAIPPGIVDLQASRDWAIHNLLNRKPVPSTTAEIDAFEKDFRDWEASVSARLANPPFLHTEKARFDTLGFINVVNMYANPRLDHLLAMLKMKLERIDEAIQAVQQRTLR
jgi:hypothetical protein